MLDVQYNQQSDFDRGWSSGSRRFHSWNDFNTWLFEQVGRYPVLVTGIKHIVGPFVMSIETEEGRPPILHSFHLGTNEQVAKRLVEERYAARVANGEPTLTIALMRDGRIWDVFDGKAWGSEVER